ncbi:lactoylglutathione lyase family protein / glyoxalase I family protein [Prunus dulcis]|uniref:Lactoylglutathione lyase n=1 Tax=Prunus dulcis TaxID=3755 RepID=A0A4Y1RM66_PRUDU|nr:lactoylglutathione lyase family protein / glyoxalase I family protein [Prunus dulcis]
MASSASITTALSRFSLIRFSLKLSPSFPHTTPFVLTKPKAPKYRFRLFSMASEPKESPANNPGLHATPDEATKSYFMQQTMFRIKDPKASLDFYSRVLGMSLLKRLDFPEMKFSLYFLGYEDPAWAPTNPAYRTVWTFGRRLQLIIGVLKVIQNSKDITMGIRNLEALHNQPMQIVRDGHIGVTVDDTYKACERFERLGVEFVKKPDDGSWMTKTRKMKGIAFIKDPDGYWVEIFDLTWRRIWHPFFSSDTSLFSPKGIALAPYRDRNW